MLQQLITALKGKQNIIVMPTTTTTTAATLLIGRRKRSEEIDEKTVEVMNFIDEYTRKNKQ